jgi:HlyD family secretion protein
MWGKLKNHKYLIILGIFLVIGIYFLIQNNQPEQKNGAKKKETTYTVKRQDLKQTLTLSGNIDAEEKVVLRFQTSGRLTWVGVKEGDMVKKYQTIASLDGRDVKKNLEKKLNTYLSERWDFEQTKDDYKNTILNDSIKRILEKSQFDLNNSVLDVELQNLSVEYATLWTPIEGIVTRIDAPYTGINITPATAEFEIINPQTVYLSVSADQNEVIKLTNGMTAEITMDSYPDASLSGIIDTISFTPKAGESGIVYEVKVKLPMNNIDNRYRIDMTADATFITKEKANVFSVPNAFVKQENDKKYLNVLRNGNGKKQKIYVETGDEYDNDTEILSGVSEGDVIYD